MESEDLYRKLAVSSLKLENFSLLNHRDASSNHKISLKILVFRCLNYLIKPGIWLYPHLPNRLKARARRLGKPVLSKLGSLGYYR